MVDDDKTGIYVVLIVAIVAVLGMMISFGSWNIPTNLSRGITGYVVSSEGLTTVHAKSLNIAPENQNNTQNFSCVWTNWKDRDNPSGTGDWETRVDFSDVCSAPLAAQCQTTGGIDWINVNEVNIICTPEDGAICQNVYNPQGCSDYIVRFCCPSTTPKPSCTDSDGGKNYYTKGTITGNLLSGNISSDMCVDDNSLREMFCNSDHYGEPTLFDCPYGCSNGACNNENTSSELNLVAKGFNVVKSDNGVLILVEYDKIGNFEELDHQTNIYVRFERYNYQQRVALDGRFMDSKGVNFDFNNKNDQYIKKIETYKDFYLKAVLDAYGNKIDESNEEDNCIEQKFKGVFDSSDSLIGITPIEEPHSCIKELCTDSDGGINYYEKGTLDTFDSSDSGTNFVDFCRVDGKLGEFNCRLIDTFIQLLSYECPNGCLDGACIFNTTNITTYENKTNNTLLIINLTTNSSVNSCIDSDNGQNYYVKGSVDGNDYHFEDYCSNEGVTLNEYICLGNYYNSTAYNCPHGCSNDACLNATTNTTVVNNVTDNKTITLADYPHPFLNNDGSLNTEFVVGSNAAVADTLGITDIVASLQRVSSISFETGIVKLDSSISLTNNQNIISVGGSCANSVTAYAYEDNKHGKCEQGYSKGYGKISLVKKDNRYILTVSGYSAEDTSKATTVLSNWKDYADIFAETNQICIYGSHNSGSIVKAC